MNSDRNAHALTYALAGWNAVAVLTIAAQLIVGTPRSHPISTAPPLPVTSQPRNDVTPWSPAFLDALIESDPFGESAMRATDPSEPRVPSMPLSMPIAASSRPSEARLVAIIGPPWRAVLASSDDGGASRVLEAGDSIGGSRVVRIVADTLLVKKGRTITGRVMSERWIP
jgi:hypothetical protein